MCLLPAIDGAALANAEEHTQSERKFIRKFIWMKFCHLIHSFVLQ